MNDILTIGTEIKKVKFHSKFSNISEAEKVIIGFLGS